MLPFPIISNTNILPPVVLTEFKRPFQSQYNNVLMLKDNILYGYGNNNYYQLGIGTGAHNTFTVCKTGVWKYWLGVQGSLLVGTDLRIYYSGASIAFPQIGTSATVWTDVTNFFSGIGIAAQDIEDCYITESFRLLTTDGRIVVCGRNAYGECGTGTQTTISTLTILPVQNVQKLRCSFDNTHYIDTSGVSYFCGLNSYGEAGIGTNSVQASFVQTSTSVLEIGAMYGTTWWFKTNGDIYWSGRNSSGQAGINNSSITSAIAMQKNNTITTSTDELIVLSNLTNSQFGSPIFSANASVRHSGANTHGEIGNGTTSSTAVYATYSIPLTLMGTWSNIYYASKDLYKTFILTKDFQLYGCGGANANSGTYLPDGSIDVTTMKLMANMPWY